MEKIISQKIQWNNFENECFLETLYEDTYGRRGIKRDPISAEEALKWEAEHKF